VVPADQARRDATRLPAVLSRIGLVGSREYEAPTPDDALLLEPLAAAGIECDYRTWDDPAVDWPSYDAVVVRNAWDYFKRIREFLPWIDARAEDGTNLWNPPPVLRWNANKRYLEELREGGVQVVETEWVAPGTIASIDEVLSARGWTRAIVKPAVSGGAFRTWSVSLGGRSDPDLAALLASDEVMVQPFLEGIVRDGEWSMVFFDGRYSHAALKRPAAGDFRVQPKHGGTVHAAAPDDALIASAEAVLAHAPPGLLYARVDGVARDGALLLMELEILEPALFFAQGGPASIERFLEALRPRLRPPGGATPSSSRATP
jgi:glutathione synthase/RimK-type ligase-like ATP-grasp enzyme